MPSAVIDVTISWVGTKILKEKTKWTVRVLKVCKLTFGNKNQKSMSWTHAEYDTEGGVRRIHFVT